MTILDSGDRTEYSSGAVRDMRKGKGRCDLMPLDVVGELLSNKIIKYIYEFTKEKDLHYLYDVLTLFAEDYFSKDEYLTGEENMANMILEVSIHFEEGAKKYGENNWCKGLPIKSYVDSAIRHYLKVLRGDKDENHERAFVWNILCCIWTFSHNKQTDIKVNTIVAKAANEGRKCSFVCTILNEPICCFNCDNFRTCESKCEKINLCEVISFEECEKRREEYKEKMGQ